MEEAGLPFDQALRLLQLPPGERTRLSVLRKWIRLGASIGDAGLKAGLFTPLEASLVHAASSSGSPSRTYRLLSDHYTRQVSRLTLIKSRMLPPVIMVAIAVVTRPLPGLVSGNLKLGGYLVEHLLPWFALATGAYLLIQLRRRLPPVVTGLGTAMLSRLLSLTPLFGPIQVRRNIRNFFDTLALLLEAGMPMLQALPVALNTVRDPALKRSFSQLKPRIEAGASFAQAVATLSFIGQAQAYALILTGEASGTLPQMLFRYAQAETAAINRFDDLMAEWLPRLAYSSAAVLIGYGVIQSGAFSPALPQDLR